MRSIEINSKRDSRSQPWRGV